MKKKKNAHLDSRRAAVILKKKLINMYKKCVSIFHSTAYNIIYHRDQKILKYIKLRVET